MRKVIERQMKFGQTGIPDIELDLTCRDEIPQLLLGLQHIYKTPAVRTQVFKILEKIVPDDVSSDRGRWGMDLWKILVLGTVRLNCNWDYDKLHDIANNHKGIREFLGHTIWDFDQKYARQTIKDNISLLTPDILDDISRVVVAASHDIVSPMGEDINLEGRCDSFVVETDVHYPTDINLLLDAIRKVLFLCGTLFGELGITEWRQHAHLFKKVKALFNRVRKMKHSTSKEARKRAQRGQLIAEAHRRYVYLVESCLLRAKTSVDILKQMGIGSVADILTIEGYIIHAERQIDQIRRRVLNKEMIPHHEKVFSIFETHTEWISKGKAGVPQELGLAVCLLEDQYGFVLHHHVMEHQKDVEIAVMMVTEAKRKFAALSACSFDKGFSSAANKADLQGMLDYVVLPKKGRLSEADKQIEQSQLFVRSRYQHAAVESAINALENHGLDRCLDHGINGFKRYVALAVLSRNVQQLGAIIRKGHLKRQKRRWRLAA